MEELDENFRLFFNRSTQIDNVRRRFRLPVVDFARNDKTWTEFRCKTASIYEKQCIKYVKQFCETTQNWQKKIEFIIKVSTNLREYTHTTKNHKGNLIRLSQNSTKTRYLF